MPFWFYFDFAFASDEKMGGLVKKKRMEHTKSWSSSNNSQGGDRGLRASERWEKIHDGPTLQKPEQRPSLVQEEKKKLGFSEQ